MDTIRFSSEAESPSDSLGECPQAFRTKDRNVRLSAVFVPFSLNPEGRRNGCIVGRHRR